jgi:hypothetical protein
MRFRWRFFSSGSSSSRIFLFASRAVLQQKVFPRHAEPDHAFRPVQIIEAITGGFAYRCPQRFAGILAHQAEQLAQGKREPLAGPRFQGREGVGDLGHGGQNRLRLGRGIGTWDGLPARGAVFG